MNKKEILDKIEKHLKHQTGEKARGRGQQYGGRGNGGKGNGNNGNGPYTK